MLHRLTVSPILKHLSEVLRHCFKVGHLFLTCLVETHLTTLLAMALPTATKDGTTRATLL